MKTFQILALVAVGLFYAIYLQRQFALRRRGIRAARLGKGLKERTTRTIEIVLLAATFAMPVAQVVSIVAGCVIVPLWLSVIGAAFAFTGVGFFLLAVVAMKDNWRAGIDASQKTKLVSRGIYRISRNPAFVGFDLFYIGIAAMFPNLFLVLLTLAGLVVFHLQILQEERYMRSVFGESYDDYTRKVRRYL